jgi:hypothetical protein
MKPSIGETIDRFWHANLQLVCVCCLIDCDHNMLILSIEIQSLYRHLSLKNKCLEQRFSTWGTRTPGGTPKVHWGYASSFLKANNLKINSKEPILRSFMYLKYTRNSVSFAIFCPGGTICIKFLFGGTHRGTTLIWGYASTNRLRTPGLEQCFSTFFSTRNPFDQQKLLRNPFAAQK